MPDAAPKPGADDKRPLTMAAPAEPPADTVTPPVDEYLFGPFRMDVASMQLWRGDTQVPLPPKAFDTLRVLISNRHRLVTKDELLSAVWPNTFVSEESVHQNITSLRRALGDDHSQPTYIATIARRGYRFVGTAEPRFSAGPADRVSAAQAAVIHPGRAAAPVVDPGPIAVAAVKRGDDIAAASDLRDVRGQAMYHRWRMAAIAASIVALVAIAGVAVSLWRPAADATPLRLSVGAPGDFRFFGGVLSPDGSMLAVIADERESGVTQLWLKPLSAQGGAPRPVPESEGAARPFWSPDGRWIGFFAKGRMKRVSVGGGPVQNIAPISGPRSSGGSWGTDGTILYASYMSGVFAVPAGGGAPRTLTALSAEHRDIAHRWPQMLSDGRHFLFTVVSMDPDRAGTYVGALDSSDTRRVIAAQGGIFADGYLVYVQERLLMAQKFDERSLEVSGSPFTLSGDVEAPTATNNATLSASSAGLLAFTAGANGRSRLEWVTRAGQPISAIESPIALYNPSLSHDQRMLMAGTGREIWLVDLERNAPTRIGPGNTTLFSPDGVRIAYTSGPVGGLSELHVQDAAGAPHSRKLLSGPENKVITDWSRDGRLIIYCLMNASSQWDLWAVPTSGDPAPQAVLATPFNECQGQVSPSGRWIAYTSDESGTSEIYVQAFPDGGSKRVISVGGGSEPQWRSDGRELFYLASDGTLTSIPFDPAAGALIGKASRLFRIPIQPGELNTRRNHYVAGTDGQRFLVNSEDHDRDSLGVLVNWTAAIR